MQNQADTKLEARGLECVRGDRRLFADLDLTLARSEMLYLAGANGSGKTSLLRILCGLLLPTKGEVRWQNQPIRQLREDYHRCLVYLGHLNALKDELTSQENLQISASLGGAILRDSQAREALEVFGVAHCADLPAKMLSQGQRRRVALSRLAASMRTPLWILDEPFAALDVRALAQVERLLLEHSAAGGMAVVTTHQEVAVMASAAVRIDLDLVAAV